MADVHDIIVHLEINNAKKLPLLIILVFEDGSINRAASGTLEEKEEKGRHFFIGVADPAIHTTIFERARSHLTEATLERLGRRFERQNVRGTPCKLTLMFGCNDRTSGRS